LQRMFFGIFITIFAILEQYISLIISILLAGIFIMMLWGVLLGFFNATEFIALQLLKTWLSTMLLSLFISTVSAIILFILLVSSTAANPLIWVAASILTLLIGLALAREATIAMSRMIAALGTSMYASVSVASQSSRSGQGTQSGAGAGAGARQQDGREGDERSSARAPRTSPLSGIHDAMRTDPKSNLAYDHDSRPGVSPTDGSQGTLSPAFGRDHGSVIGMQKGSVSSSTSVTPDSGIVGRGRSSSSVSTTGTGLSPSDGMKLQERAKSMPPTTSPSTLRSRSSSMPTPPSSPSGGRQEGTRPPKPSTPPTLPPKPPIKPSTKA
jgi:hypothetical protein